MNLHHIPMQRRFNYAHDDAPQSAARARKRTGARRASPPHPCRRRRRTNLSQAKRSPCRPSARQNVGSLPMNMIATPDGKFVITTDMGFRQSLVSLRASDGVVVSRLEFPGGEGFRTRPAPAPTACIMVLRFRPIAMEPARCMPRRASRQHRRRACGRRRLSGADRHVHHTPCSTDFTAGIALFTRNGVTYLAAAENDPNTFLTPCSLAIFNTTTGPEVGRYQFINPNFAAADPRSYSPNFPLAVSALADGSKIFVSSQRDGAVYVLNATNPAAPTLCRSPSRRARIRSPYCSTARRRACSSPTPTAIRSRVLNTATNTVTATILLRPTGATTIAGATPTNLALSPDEKTLYVTLGDMNAVAVVEPDPQQRDRATFPSAGILPAFVATAQKKLLVSNAKGTTDALPQSRLPSSAVQRQPRLRPEPDRGQCRIYLAFLIRPPLPPNTRQVLWRTTASRPRRPPRPTRWRASACRRARSSTLSTSSRKTARTIRCWAT